MKVVIEKNPDKRISSEEKQLKIGKGFIYHQSHQPFIKIKLLVKNLETEPEIYVNKIEKRLYKIDRLIQFLGRFEKANGGIAFVHGAAVVNPANQGILIGAQQDVGKTTSVFLLQKNNGYSVLGDDYLNVSKDGYLYRAQQEMGIFPHPDNLRDIPLSLKERITGRIKYHLFSNPPFSHLVYPNLRVPYEKLKSTKDKAKLEKVFILEKGSPGISEMDKNEAVRKILATTFDLILPEGFVRRLFYNYCFGNDISPVHLENECEKILLEAFKSKKVFKMTGKSPFDFYHLFLEHEAG